MRRTLVRLLRSVRNKSHFLVKTVLNTVTAFSFNNPIGGAVSLFSSNLLIDNICKPRTIGFINSVVPPFNVALSFLLAHRGCAHTRHRTLGTTFPVKVYVVARKIVPVTTHSLLQMIKSYIITSTITNNLVVI